MRIWIEIKQEFTREDLRQLDFQDWGDGYWSRKIGKNVEIDFLIRGQSFELSVKNECNGLPGFINTPLHFVDESEIITFINFFIKKKQNG